MTRVFLVFLLFLAGTARAEIIPTEFDVRLYGVKLGTLVAGAEDNGAVYNAEARFGVTGAVGLIANVRFAIASSGRTKGLTIDPVHYVEDMNTGRRRTTGKVEFAAGDDRIDPMSALLLGVRDRPVSAGCALNHIVFDGERTMGLVLQKDRSTAQEMICSGRLSRKAGYSDKDLSESKGYPFTITYQRQGNLFRAMQVKVKSLFGPVTITRR